jgi:hypothetical protein
VRELSRDWRQNPLLLHTLRARGFRLGVFSLFVLLALAVAASLVASSRTMPSDALGIMLAIGMVFYSLSVPFLLAMVIPLAGRSYSRQMRSEIWLTGMPTREVAFGVLVPPILATATIIVVYPLMMAILLAATNVERVSAFLQDLISLGNTASEGLRATVAVLLVYLTFGLGSAYVPLLSRIRTFRIAWSPVLIAPVWGLLTLAAAVGPMVVISMETSRVFMSAFPAGDAYLEANQNLSFAAVLVIFMGGVMAMSESLAGRAGLRWLGDAVPEAAADLDWAFRERGFSDQPGDVQIRQWGDFTRRAWLWWRPRLKWAALGLAIAHEFLRRLSPAGAWRVVRDPLRDSRDGVPSRDALALSRARAPPARPVVDGDLCVVPAVPGIHRDRDPAGVADQLWREHSLLVGAAAGVLSALWDDVDARGPGLRDLARAAAAEGTRAIVGGDWGSFRVVCAGGGGGVDVGGGAGACLGFDSAARAVGVGASGFGFDPSAAALYVGGTGCRGGDVLLVGSFRGVTIFRPIWGPIQIWLPGLPVHGVGACSPARVCA